ncbi:MAG: TIGR03118 family protein [Myxococcales bacterium]
MSVRSLFLSGRLSMAVALIAVGACSDSSSGTTSAISNAYGDGDGDGTSGGSNSATYTPTALVGDTSGSAPVVDPNLINPWGIAYGPDTAFWVADNGTGKSTVYDGKGAPQPANAPLIVGMPLPAGSADKAAKPTGIAYYGGKAFKVSASGESASARFLFATEQGTILGWTSDLTPDEAILAVDASGDDAIFKGLTLVPHDKSEWLAVTDFHNGVIRVYDDKFKPVTLAKGAFVDSDLPQGYAPFGIQLVGKYVYVTYAQQDADKEDDVPGEGLGYVSQFKTDGTFVKQVISKTVLNAPWAVAVAPKRFGKFGGALLIGNFGDGTINAFDSKSHKLLGTLSGGNGKPLVIDGLWGLVAGNGKGAGSSNTLYFTAGPSDESHGVFGKIEAK